MATATQMKLISGYYRCHNCGRDVDHVHRVRRWRLCNDCYQAIVVPTRPDHRGELTDAIWQAREAFWTWYYEMEKKYPFHRSWSPSRRKLQRDADAYWPFCQCGRRRKPLPFGQPGLFGGPYQKYCPVCDARFAVEATFRLANNMPSRDDEDWLDLLYQSHREAFILGILPDYWYELKHQEIQSI